MTLLTIVQDVCGRLSLPQPSVVVASTDKQVIQLYSLANQEGKSLARRYQWQALVEELTFTTTATTVQSAVIPADLDRFIPNTFFNRSQRREMVGPLTAREWQALLANPVSGRIYLAFRERQSEFLITPTPAAGQTVACEYVSLNWALSAASVAQASFLADTDTSYLDDELIKLGLQWRYLRAKGLDYAEEMDTYEREVEMAMARDGTSTMISIAPGQPDLNRINLPDGNFGL